MEKQNNQHIELRSEKVRNIIGNIPASLMRWGLAVNIIILLLLLAVALLVPYPYAAGESIMEHILGF